MTVRNVVFVTSVAGSSEWFECGLVTYSNRSKTELAGVPEHLIDQYGAVSEKVACAMASGAISRTAATVALSVTGIAGPSGERAGCLTQGKQNPRIRSSLGAVAQLGERYNGIVEVVGSIPSGSTIHVPIV